MQDTYGNSATTDPQIQLSNTNGGLKIRDASSSTITNLFQIQNSAGSSTYFAVTNAGIKTNSIEAASGSTIAIGTSNTAHTINIGTGTGVQAVTVGSTDSSSGTTIQGGSGGIKLSSSGNGGITFDNNSAGTPNFIFSRGGTPVLTLDYADRLTLQPTSDTNALFRVVNHAGGTLLNVDSTTGITSVNELQVSNGGISNDGALTFTGTTVPGTYVTPLGASISTLINIQNRQLFGYGQLLALGVTGNSASTTRGITVADARTGTHQATIAVLSPDEAQVAGIGWQGATNTTGLNGTPVLSSTSSVVGLANSVGTGLVLSGSGSVQTALLGSGSSTTGAIQLNNSTNGNSATIQAPSVSTSYITNLPTAIGTAGQCLSVASIAGSTQTLGYASCLSSTSGIQNQNASAQSSANFWISGTGKAASGLQAPSLDTLTAGTLTLGGATATSIVLGNTASGNYITFTAAGGLVYSGTARHTKTILLTPEYAGATLDALSDASCSSTYNGTMTSGYSGDSSPRQSYYNWASGAASTNCYDVIVQVPLPSTGTAGLPHLPCTPTTQPAPTVHRYT
jgi:hypothetical protein